MRREEPVQRYDVLVLGTGAAGLVAALAAADRGASVGLFEKAACLGGTTCLSSGVAWIPVNRHAAAAGIADSREDALAYLSALSLDMIIPELAEALVDTGPQLIDWLETSTPLTLRLVPGFPDYHPEHPGESRRADARWNRSCSRSTYLATGPTGWSARPVRCT